jgi:Flp pilus assembly protein TadD
MNLTKLTLALGVVGVVGVSGVVGSTREASAQGNANAPLEAPKNVNVEPSTPASRSLSSQAASAQMSGDPRAALTLAERAIAADPRDPWGHYNRADALARLGRTDEAVSAFGAAEQRFAASDMWGRSVAIYGSAHALSQAGRCDEARREFIRYADFVRPRDPLSADLATSYATTCRAPAKVPSAQPPG